ncbi:614_t:CDS:2, partial [Acaulospora morrowiae]
GILILLKINFLSVNSTTNTIASSISVLISGGSVIGALRNFVSSNSASDSENQNSDLLKDSIIYYDERMFGNLKNEVSKLERMNKDLELLKQSQSIWAFVGSFILLSISAIDFFDFIAKKNSNIGIEIGIIVTGIAGFLSDGKLELKEVHLSVKHRNTMLYYLHGLDPETEN